MVPTVFFSFLSFLFFLSFLSFFLSQPLHTAHCNRTRLAGNPQNKRRCSGWWLTYLPLWKIMEFVSWDFLKFPTKWKVIKFMFQITNQIIWTLGMVHCHVWLPEGTSNVIPFRMITAILLTWDLLPPKSHDYIWKSSSCVDLGDPYQLHPKKNILQKSSDMFPLGPDTKTQNYCSFTTSCRSILFTGWGQEWQDSHQMSFCRSLKTYFVSTDLARPTICSKLLLLVRRTRWTRRRWGRTWGWTWGGTLPLNGLSSRSCQQKTMAITVSHVLSYRHQT